MNKNIILWIIVLSSIILSANAITSPVAVWNGTTVNSNTWAQDAINQYNRKSLTALEMLELLLEITKDVNTETAKGKDLGLTDTEKAFYDALSVNKSAKELMGDEKLMIIAKELVDRVRRSTNTDWTVRQSAKDKVKLEVKRVLRFHKYPPDDEPRAVDTVVEQAELHARELV